MELKFGKTVRRSPDSLLVMLLIFAGSCGQSQLGDEEFSSTPSNPEMMTMTSPSAGKASMATPTQPETGGKAETGGSTGSGGEAASSPARPDVIDETAVIQSVHAHVILPTFTLEKNVDALKDAINAWAAKPDPTSLEAAQVEWKKTMAVWQEAELLQFGPTGGLGRVGYENLRELIFSFPGTNACRIDHDIQRERFRNAEWIDVPNSGYNIQGLDALEYLLFHSFRQ